MYIEDEFNLTEYKTQFIHEWQRRIKKRERMFYNISLFLCAVFLFTLSAFLLATQSVIQRNEQKKNKEIYAQAFHIMHETPASLSTPAPAPEPAPAASTPASDGITPEAKHGEPKKVLKQIENLRAAFTNNDIVGYLSIDGTAIDYPIVQTDDNEFYLRRDITGKSNSAGTLMLDYECDAGGLSRNTVIYGHNMRDGSMFHDLRYYEDAAFRQEHPFIMLTTLYEETTWEIFAVYKTSPDFYYIQVIFPDDASFTAFLSSIKEKSAYDTGMEVSANDKILTLSTCSTNPSDTRWVVNAKQVL